MPFEKSVFVPQHTADTFSLITAPDGLRRWLAITARVDLSPGGAYRWTIGPGESVRGSYVEVESGDRVVFTLGWEGESKRPTSTVTITLEPVEGGTTVRLAHDGPSWELIAGNGDGWAHYLTRLAEAGARGDAGFDDWAAVPPDVDAITCAEAALAICQRVLRDVPGGEFARPTPCTEYNVQQLADHLVRSIMFFGGAAGAEYPAEQAGDAAGLETQIANAAQVALEAWTARGLGGSIRVRGKDTPADLALGIMPIELLVHAWDFGRALGRDIVVSDRLADSVLGFARRIISTDLRAGGSYADVVPVGADMPVFDQLIAFTGRVG